MQAYILQAEDVSTYLQTNGTVLDHQARSWVYIDALGSYLIDRWVWLFLWNIITSHKNIQTLQITSQ